MGDEENVYYLKSFVRMHPDNRMAWYLLGKKYEEAGKLAKANYCYMQAGDVYEAFERKSHPFPPSEPELEQLRQWNGRKRGVWRRRRSAAVALILLLLALLPAEPSASPLWTPDVLVLEGGKTAESREDFQVVFSRRGDRTLESAWGQALALKPGPALTIAAKLEETNDWRLWNGRTKLLMTVAAGESGADLAARMYDSETCLCRPAVPANGLMEKLADWKKLQETKWTLASAIMAYRSLNGRLPSSIDDLVRPYPDNIMAGEARGMRDLFGPLVLALARENGPDGKSGGTKDRSLEGQAAEGPKRSQRLQPLEIVVDKTTHLLAVVSGDIIVRSYKVGLGADRTPEGEFTISEKVKNPNGTGKGPFGSRGMALSEGNYAIHGTDEPESVGEDESLGCVRMKREDLEELYDIVPLGTKVTIKKGTILPETALEPETRFRLKPSQDETNPDRVYNWLD